LNLRALIAKLAIATTPLLYLSGLAITILAAAATDILRSLAHAVNLPLFSGLISIPDLAILFIALSGSSTTLPFVIKSLPFISSSSNVSLRADCKSANIIFLSAIAFSFISPPFIITSDVLLSSCPIEVLSFASSTNSDAFSIVLLILASSLLRTSPT